MCAESAGGAAWSVGRRVQREVDARVPECASAADGSARARLHRTQPRLPREELPLQVCSCPYTQTHSPTATTHSTCSSPYYLAFTMFRFTIMLMSTNSGLLKDLFPMSLSLST